MAACDLSRNSPTQNRFHLGFLQQSFERCKNPMIIYGPDGGSVIAWNQAENIVVQSTLPAPETTIYRWCSGESYYEDAFLLHPYNYTSQCLSAPLDPLDPITVSSCQPTTGTGFMNIAWNILYRAPINTTANSDEL
ncbi:6484_t:CDS:2 [Ambispora leptoticha]|uniref:6484_t:CDS:1 n=1 Tax=Ambispora leptoticha TaxID=144679 RepID=A0A9N8V9M1_9GLOM|nr:6484_t:CDS:2 [Ambispora leptoticha]